MMAVVFAALLTVAMLVPAHLDEIANPADANYVPRPEWYFLSLFQLLQVPSRARSSSSPRRWCRAWSSAALFALPFLDRGVSPPSVGAGAARVHRGVRRHRPRRRRAHLARACATRRPASIRTAGGRSRWPATCWSRARTRPASRCHVDGGPGSPVRDTRISRDDDWLLFHMADPAAIAPGARPADPEFTPVLDDDQARAVLAYLRRLRAGAAPPPIGRRRRPDRSGFSARGASPATRWTATAAPSALTSAGSAPGATRRPSGGSSPTRTTTTATR